MLSLVLVAVAGCGQAPPQAQPAGETHATLPQGVAARVGDDVITVSAVQQVAQLQGVSPEQARDRLISDALFAAGARGTGLVDRSDAATMWRAALARKLLENERDQARKQPVSEDEIARFTALHWLDLDRPAGRTSVHAVVIVKDAQDKGERARAQAVAQHIAEVVKGTRDAAQFIERAKAVPNDGFQVVAESISVITEDGRMVDLVNRPPPGADTPMFDVDFAKALFGIAALGEQTGPSLSAFGAHVIMLTGLQPEQRFTFEERKAKLTSEILASRAQAATETLVQGLRAKTETQIARNAGTQLVTVQLPDAIEGP